MKALLKKLKVAEHSLGACAGAAGWQSDPDGVDLVSLNPSTGQMVGAVKQVTTTTCDWVIEQAAEAFVNWRERPAPKRGMLISDLGAALKSVLEPLGELITLETGKIKAEGVGEVQEMIDICGFAAGLSRQLYGVTTHSERPGHRMYEQWLPLGPIGVITAFNFPVAVWSWNAAIAAVCGDTMVWKPSPLAPISAIAVQHLCNQVMADHGALGVFTLVIGSNEEVGEQLIGSPRLPLISFTGSVAVGRHVARTVAWRLGRTILELGGNNGVIVSADADMDLAVRAILFGAVGTAGQRCTTTRRLFLHRSITESFLERLLGAYRQVRVGNPLDPGVLMGPLITEHAVETMMTALEAARAQGGQILTGGNRLPELGPCFVEPAIVRMPAQTPVVLQETFAPILYVMEYDELQQAVALHNRVPQGLSSAIFTNSLRAAEKFLSASGSDCGLANVNLGTSGAEIGLGFGGEKETGGGRESGSDAWKAYMRRQSNVINWSGDLPLAQGIRFGSD